MNIIIINILIVVGFAGLMVKFGCCDFAIITVIYALLMMAFWVYWGVKGLYEEDKK